MMWRGLAGKSSPCDDTPGVSEYQQNTRMRVKGELQRRWGMLSSSIAKQAGPIYGIASANPAGGNFLTFDVLNDAVPGTALLGGFGPPPVPPWQPPKKKKPIGNACAIYAMQATGSQTDVGQSITLPGNSCAGVVVVVGIESGGRGDPYGYQFEIEADGVNILSSACLVDDSEFAVIPPGTTTITYSVFGGCSSPAGDFGAWIVDVQS